MKFNNESAEQQWRKLKDTNRDKLGRGILTYAERWANMMEALMLLGGSLEATAEFTSHLADKEGMSGSGYVWAVAILSKVWIHGEQLQHWHNLDIGGKERGDIANKEGKILDPTIISIG